MARRNLTYGWAAAATASLLFRRFGSTTCVPLCVRHPKSMDGIADLRESYRLGEFTEANALADPLRQFHIWFQEAQNAGVREANAMALATADGRSCPNVRIVLLKGLDSGFVFYTNYQSVKAVELGSNPNAAICFHWKELERQVRAAGRVEKVTSEESDEYFQSRPRGSQISAIASPQSRKISGGRGQLEAMYARTEQDFRDNVPRPETWGGYRLTPEWIEFWQGRANRLHDRLRYEREGAAWSRARLAP